MTATSGIDRDRAEGEAATWLVRLSDGQADAELLAAFEAWRIASPLNAASWERARLAYDLIGKREPRHQDHWRSYTETRRGARSLLPERSASWKLQPPRRAWHPRWRKPLQLVGGLAAAACIALLAGMLLPAVLIRLQADVATRTAELRSLHLEDGSQLSLAPESAIALAFVAGERRVRLIRGSAFFEVSRDEAHPFHVEAGDAVIAVLGTEFEVRRSEHATFVAVKHGRVRVDDMRSEPTPSNMLQVGEWIRVPSAGPVVRGTLAQDEIATWRFGKLVALDRPAGDVVNDIRHYYPGVIVVQSRAFAERRVSGIYDLKDPASTLRDLASSHGGRVRELSDWLMIITGGTD